MAKSFTKTNKHDRHTQRWQFFHKLQKLVFPEKNIFHHQMSLLHIISVLTNQILLLFAHGI